MRHLPLLMLSVVALAVVGGVAQERDGSHDTAPVTPFRIIGGIYYVGMADISSFLIATPNGHVLLDSTYEHTVPVVQKGIESLGFELRDIRIILNSHAHSDHLGGHKRMKDLTGARVVMSEPDAAVLADGGRSDFQNAENKQLYPALKSDRVIQDGEEVRLGGVTLVAHLTPGHTKGCTTWTTVVEESGQEYDVVFACGLPSRGQATPNAKYPGMREDTRKAFATARGVQADVFLAQHGRAFRFLEKMKRHQEGATPNPFIDPQGFRAYAEERERLFLEALEKQAPERTGLR